MGDIKVYSAWTGKRKRIERIELEGRKLEVVRKGTAKDPKTQPAFVRKDGTLSLYPEGSEADNRAMANIEGGKYGR